MNRRWSCGLAIVASIAILMAVKISVSAEPDDKGPPERPAAPEAKKFSGTVQQFNYTPRGERDGVLLTSDGKLVQLNFSPREAAKLADAVAVGDQITAEGTPERGEADHTVCRLQKLTTAKGKEIEIEGAPPRPRGRETTGPDEGNAPEGRRGSRNAETGPPRRGERTPEKTETVKGVVKYLNHGPRGEVDGAVLESGDFVHIGPREAEEAKLAVGQDISVEGQAMKMPDGHTMIEHPTKINDKEVTRGPSRRRGAGPEEGPMPPPGDASRRAMHPRKNRAPQQAAPNRRPSPGMADPALCNCEDRRRPSLGSSWVRASTLAVCFGHARQRQHKPRPRTAFRIDEHLPPEMLHDFSHNRQPHARPIRMCTGKPSSRLENLFARLNRNS